MIVINIFTIKRHLILYLDVWVWRDPGTKSYHYFFEAPFVILTRWYKKKYT
jgi:hypothetical protein